MPTIKVADIKPGMVVKPLPVLVPGLSTSGGLDSLLGKRPLVVSNIQPHPYNPAYRYLMLNEAGYYFPIDAPCFDVVSEKEAEDYRVEQLKNFRKSPYTRKGFTIGCDPEIFIEDANGVVIPAFRFLDSKKVNSLMFWDGFQAEFASSVHQCLEELSRSVRGSLQRLWMQAKSHDPNAKLALKTVVNIPEAMLKSCTKQQIALGCDPSQNIYKLHGVCVDQPELLDIRFAGGHMHFGIGKNIMPDVLEEIIKTLDAIAGVVSISLFGSIENPLRRKFYGLPGEYRLPPHGLEYRTLGNGWMCASGAMHLMWDIARAALDIGRRNLRAAWEYDEQEVIDVIINGDVQGARKILTANKDMLEKLLSDLYSDYHPRMAVKKGMQAIFNGIESVVEDPLDLVHNWELDADYTWDLERTRWSTLAVRTRV